MGSRAHEPGSRAAAVDDGGSPGRAVHLDELPVGRPLARDIRAVGGTATLLAAGRVLTAAHVEAMRRSGVREVVAGGPEVDPGAERSFVSRRVRVTDLASAVRDDVSVSTPVRLDADAISALAHAGVDELEVLVDPAADGAVPAAAVAQPHVGRILGDVLRANRRTSRPETRAQDVRDGRRAAAALDAAIEAVAWSAPAAELLLTSGLRPGFLGPAIETALMVAIAGARRGWDDERLRAASIAGMFADIGMLRLPEAILFKPGALNEEERRVMRAHTERGAATLRTLAAAVSPLAAEVALQHHERIDGTGYPRGLSGDAIHPEAQLVAMSHLYLAATLGRSYRRPLPPSRAFGLIEGMADAAWDAGLVRAFVGGIAPYPVGSLVRLSSGECGVVVATADALRPLVEVRWAADGSVLRPHLVAVGADGVTVAAISD
jgi:hypothetical protein